jgi:hypothetical protein
MAKQTKLTWIRHRLSGLISHPRKSFTLFAIGAVLFFVGLGGLYFAERSLAAGLISELVALASFATLTMGAMLSLVGYIALFISRLFKPADTYDRPDSRG